MMPASVANRQRELGHLVGSSGQRVGDMRGREERGKSKEQVKGGNKKSQERFKLIAAR